MSELAERKRKLIEDLSFVEDPQERMQFLIDWAKEVDPLPEDLRIDVFKVDGCVARLWLVPEFREGRCYFQVDSDGIISKAVAHALADTFCGCTPEEIQSDGPEFLAEVGITQHLTPNRRNGLSNVWSRISAFADACSRESSAD